MKHSPALENILDMLRQQLPMLAERYHVDTLFTEQARLKSIRDKL